MNLGLSNHKAHRLQSIALISLLFSSSAIIGINYSSPSSEAEAQQQNATSSEPSSPPADNNSTSSSTETGNTTTVVSSPIVTNDSSTADNSTIIENSAPIADAGDDQSYVVVLNAVEESQNNNGTTSGANSTTFVVILNGSGSFDLEGDPLAYYWTQVDGPGVALQNGNSATASFDITNQVSDTSGNKTTDFLFSFSLVVSDSQLNSTADTVDISVSLLNNETSESTPLPSEDSETNSTSGDSENENRTDGGVQLSANSTNMNATTDMPETALDMVDLLGDDFDNAIMITDLPYTDNRNTINATKSDDDPSAFPCPDFSHSVWYSIKPSVSEKITISTEGSDFDTILATYTGTRGNLTLVDCNDDFSGAQSVVEVEPQIDQTLYIMAASYGDNSGGDLVFAVNVSLPPPPPPANDDFDNATRITQLPFSQTVDNRYATAAVDDPDCNGGGHTLWYRYGANMSDSLIVSTSNGTSDSTLSVYVESNDGLSQISCQYSGGFPISLVSVEAGQTYYIMIGTYYDNPAGSLTLDLEVAPPPPANDDFDNATLISELPFLDTIDTVSATSSADDPGSCGPVTATVWYAYEAEETHTLEAILSDTGYYTPVLIFTGTRDNLAQIGSNCYSGSTIFEAEAGQTYFIMIGKSAYPEILGGEITFSLDIALSPSNDNFNNATRITELPFYDTVDTTYATSDNDDGFCYGNANSVWYSFTPTEAQHVLFKSGDSSYDTTLSLYTGSPGNLTSLACRFFYPNDSSGIIVRVESGTTYYLMVAAPYGPGALNLSVDVAPPLPANDNFNNATRITELPFYDTVDTTYATVDNDDPSYPCYYSDLTSSIWYSFTATQSQNVAFRSNGSNYDAVFTIYTGSRGELNQLQCRLFYPYDTTSFIFPVQAGTTYYLMVAAAYGPGGYLAISVDTAPPPPANDDFDNATLISSSIFTDTLVTTYATTGPDDPFTSCYGATNTVWYEYTSNQTQLVSATTAGTNYVNTISVYSGSRTNYTLITCSISTEYIPRPVYFKAQAGQTYRFMIGVDPFVTFYEGTLVFSLEARNDNDDVDNAMRIATLPFRDELDTNDATTKSEDPPTPCAYGQWAWRGGHSVWYSITPINTQSIALSTAGSEYPPTMSVFRGSPEALNQVSCQFDYYFSDDYAHRGRSRLTFTAEAGQTYYIMVTGEGGHLIFSAEGAPPNNHISIPVGPVPRALAVNPVNHNIYVVTATGTLVSVVDGTSLNEIATIPIGLYANYQIGADLAFNPLNGNMYVPTSEGNISVVGTDNFIKETIHVEATLRGIAYNPLNGNLYATTCDSDYGCNSGKVYVIDGATNTIIANVTAGILPYAIAVDSTTGNVYVTDQANSTVYVIGPSDNTILDAIPVDNDPEGIAVNPVNGDIYVANTGNNTVSVIDPISRLVVQTIPVGRLPFDIVNDARGRLFVSNPGDQFVSVIDGATRSLIGTIAAGHAYAMAFDPVTENVYVSNCCYSDDLLTVIPAPSSPIVASVGCDETFFASITGLGFEPNTQLAADVLLTSKTGEARLLLDGRTDWFGNYRGGITWQSLNDENAGTGNNLLIKSRDRLQLTFYYLTNKNGSLSIDLTNPLTTTTFTEGCNPLPQPIELPFASIDWGDSLPREIIYDSQSGRILVTAGFPGAGVVMLNETKAQLNFEAGVRTGSSAWGMTMDTLNSKLYVVDEMDNNVSVVDTATRNVVGRPIAVGTNPHFIAFNPASGKLYVTNTVDNTVSVINSANNSVEATIPVGNSPLGIVLDSASGKLYVSNIGDNTVSVINGTTDTVVGTISLDSGAAGYFIAFDARNQQLYLGGGFGYPHQNTITMINGTTDSVSGTIPLNSAPGPIVVDPSSGLIYVIGGEGNGTRGLVNVIDDKMNSVVDTLYWPGRLPVSAALDSDTGRLYIVDVYDERATIFGININPTLTIKTIGLTTPIEGSTHNFGEPIFGAGFTITPNPYTLQGSLFVSDNGPYDMDGSEEILLRDLHRATYSISQTLVPEGYKKIYDNFIVDANSSPNQQLAVENIANDVPVTDLVRSVILPSPGLDPDQSDFYNNNAFQGLLTGIQEAPFVIVPGSIPFQITRTNLTSGVYFVTVSYNPNDLGGNDPSMLRLFEYDPGGVGANFTDITLRDSDSGVVIGVNSTANTVTGETDLLGIFALAAGNLGGGNPNTTTNGAFASIPVVLPGSTAIPPAKIATAKTIRDLTSVLLPSVLFTSKAPAESTAQQLFSSFKIPVYPSATQNVASDVFYVAPAYVIPYQDSKDNFLLIPIISQVQPGLTLIAKQTSFVDSQVAEVKKVEMKFNTVGNGVGFSFGISDSPPPGTPPAPFDAPALYLDIGYVGDVNFGNPSAFVAPPTIDILVNKTLPNFNILADGCADFGLLYFNGVEWTVVNKLRESALDTDNQCGFIVEPPHFSKFGIGGVKGGIITVDTNVALIHHNKRSVEEEAAPILKSGSVTVPVSDTNSGIAANTVELELAPNNELGSLLQKASTNETQNGQSRNIILTFDKVLSAGTLNVEAYNITSLSSSSSLTIEPLKVSASLFAGTLRSSDDSNYHLLDNTLYEIQHSVEMQYDGHIYITAPYDEQLLKLRNQSENDIRLLHYDGLRWEDATISINFTANTVTGMTSSLSSFIIATSDDGLYSKAYFDQNPLKRLLVQSNEETSAETNAIQLSPDDSCEGFTVSTALANLQRTRQPYTFVTQVIDRNNTVVAINFMNGSLDIGEIGSLRTPCITMTEEVDRRANSLKAMPYILKVFVITGLGTPDILTDALDSQLLVTYGASNHYGFNLSKAL